MGTPTPPHPAGPPEAGPPEAGSESAPSTHPAGPPTWPPVHPAGHAPTLRRRRGWPYLLLGGLLLVPLAAAGGVLAARWLPLEPGPAVTSERQQEQVDGADAPQRAERRAGIRSEPARPLTDPCSAVPEQVITEVVAEARVPVPNNRTHQDRTCEWVGNEDGSPVRVRVVRVTILGRTDTSSVLESVRKGLDTPHVRSQPAGKRFGDRALAWTFDDEKKIASAGMFFVRDGAMGRVDVIGHDMRFEGVGQGRPTPADTTDLSRMARQVAADVALPDRTALEERSDRLRQGSLTPRFDEPSVPDPAERACELSDATVHRVLGKGAFRADTGKDEEPYRCDYSSTWDYTEKSISGYLVVTIHEFDDPSAAGAAVARSYQLGDPAEYAVVDHFERLGLRYGEPDASTVIVGQSLPSSSLYPDETVAHVVVQRHDTLVQVLYEGTVYDGYSPEGPLDPEVARKRALSVARDVLTKIEQR